MTSCLPVRPEDSSPWRPGMYLFSGKEGRTILLIKVHIALGSKAAGMAMYGDSARIANNAIERMMDEDV